MSKPHVLVVLELGANLGHVLRLWPLAQSLMTMDWQVSFAVPDVAHARRFICDTKVAIVETVKTARPPASNDQNIVPESYAQILQNHGFADKDQLESNVASWQNILQTIQPDVLLIEFCPVALLAAHCLRKPAVHLAIGWEAPIAQSFEGVRILPLMGAPTSHKIADAKVLQQALLAHINACCTAHAVPQLADLAALYTLHPLLLATWPEADHFGPRQSGRYIGPLYAKHHGQRAQWPAQAGTGKPRVFIYLQRHACNVHILKALNRIGALVIAVLPDATITNTQELADNGVQIYTDAVQLEPLLKMADLVINNASHGLTLACLAVGCPVLGLPLTFEHQLSGVRLAKTGAVQLLLPKDIEIDARAQLRSVLENSAMKFAALGFSAKYSAAQFQQGVSMVHQALSDSKLSNLSMLERQL